MLGLFIVTRDSGPPELHVIGEDTERAYLDRMALVDRRQIRDGRAQVIRQFWGSSCTGALMVSPKEAAIMVAEQYTGPDSDIVRAMASLVALGEPIPTDEDSGKGPDGGSLERLPTGPKPKTPGPARVNITSAPSKV